MKTNADLQKSVYEELKWDSRINEGDIGVSVNDGIVTLSGTIPTFAEKWAAEAAVCKVVGAVRHLSGVTGVTNDVVIESNLKTKDIHVEANDEDVTRPAFVKLRIIF